MSKGPRSSTNLLREFPARSGTLSNPTIGEFKNVGGDFYDQGTLNGPRLFVRFVISGTTPDSWHLEQSFQTTAARPGKSTGSLVTCACKAEAPTCAKFRLIEVQTTWKLEHRHLDLYGARRDEMRRIFDTEGGVILQHLPCFRRTAAEGLAGFGFEAAVAGAAGCARRS